MGTGSGAPDFGTGGGSGSTFPGAVLPFGMTQFSPDTIPSRSNTSGGYSYEDGEIRGFSLTHFSGAGCPIFEDVPILPTSVPIESSPAVPGSSGTDARYVPHFDHRHEHATPGAYSVVLNPGSAVPIDSELTVTRRTADARFTFAPGAPASILINAGGSPVANSAASVQVDARRREISGSAESGHFCAQPTTYRLYFVARFNRPFAASGTWDGQTLHPATAVAAGNAGAVQVGAYASFDTRRARSVEMDVGVSFTSPAEARKNLDAEARGRSFGALRAAAENAWRSELAKVTVSGGDNAERRLFYTSLYHALIEPSTFSDADGSYMGMDGRIHDAGSSTQYTNVSGWDVYRSQTPLMTILEPQRAADLATSLVRDAGESGCLPRWPYANQQTNVQNGDPSDPIIAEIHAFGARGFDAGAALDRMIAGASAACHTANGDYTEREGLSDYLRLGYVPIELNTGAAGHTIGDRALAWGAAATTLEYALADSTIASLAAGLGRRDAARSFRRRAENWTRLFDRASGITRPRYRSGQWLASHPTSQAGFVEGNGAQYTWLVPQDPAGLFQRMGGDVAARRRLDRFFHELNAGPNAPYAYLGNEPTLAVPWLYDWLGRPARTTDVVHRALLGLYAATPGGMPGNDDGGAMSAWWVLGALGIYPALPGTDVLAVNGPLFARAEIALAHGRLTIEAPGVTDSRRYVQSARLDGKAFDRAWLSLGTVARGTHVIELRMGASSRSRWATATESRPPSLGRAHASIARGTKRRARASSRSDAPTQFIAKQFTEGLGRGPTAEEWTHWVGVFSRPERRCGPRSMAVLTRAVFLGREFRRLRYRWVEALGALSRAALNHDLDATTYRRYGSPRIGWPQVVRGILESGAFSRETRAICQGPLPAYYFDNSVRPMQTATGPGFRGTATELQRLMDARAGAGGGTVWLARAAVIVVGRWARPGLDRLHVPPGVTLATVGRPGPHSYAKMARLVRNGATCFFAGLACRQAVLTVDGSADPAAPGGRAESIWIDAHGGNPYTTRESGFTAAQLESGANSAIMASRLDGPVPNSGAGTDVLGLQGTGNWLGLPCTHMEAIGNLLTAYSTDHFLKSRWADGIGVGCEDADVERNTIVDATDAGISLFGVPGADQHSLVRDNYIVSAGNYAYAALNVDPHGACSRLCDDMSTRNFAGSLVEDNTFVSGPRTGFGFGINLGIRPLFPYPPDGTGATAIDNGTGRGSARVNVGLAVSGMYDARLSGNTGQLILARINRCPLVRSAASVSSGLASFAAPPPPYADVPLVFCWFNRIKEPLPPVPISAH